MVLSPTKPLGFPGLVLVALLLSGCGDPGPAPLPVTGKITLDGQPLPRGAVSLIPEDGANFERPTGIVKDGQFTVYLNQQPGATVGAYRVVVFATEATTTPDGAAHPGLPKSIVPARYNNPVQSPLRLDVQADASQGQYDLELQSRDK